MDNNTIQLAVTLPVSAIGDRRAMDDLALSLSCGLPKDIESYIRQPEMGQSVAAHTFDALCTRQHADMAILQATLRGLLPTALLLPRRKRLCMILFDTEPYVEEPYDSTKIELFAYVQNDDQSIPWARRQPTVICIAVELTRLHRLLH